MTHFWELDNPERQLRIRLKAYQAALVRSGGSRGPAIRRRAAELRRLAEESGELEQLELILRALHPQSRAYQDRDELRDRAAVGGKLRSN